MAVMMAGCGDSGQSADVRAQPNIIVLITDDQDAVSIRQMPALQRWLVEGGTTFERAFVTLAICCPSRASSLRGQYPHNHGVLDNPGRPFGGYDRFAELELEESTLATWLQDAGYFTILLGKYLNGYMDGHVPRGWDEWHGALNHEGRFLSFYDYYVSENGVVTHYGSAPEDYETDVLARKAVRLINEATSRGAPFFMWLAPFAPHAPSTPAPRHKHLLSTIPVYRPPAFNEEDVTDKPPSARRPNQLTEAEIADIDARYRAKIVSLFAVDEMLDTIVRTLADAGALDDTYIFFTSDNGIHMGEHRLLPGKALAYEEDIRVPLVVRGPDVVQGHVEERLVLNNDLAPTIAELAGAEVPDFVDGRSFVPLLRGEETVSWRSGFYVSLWDRYQSIRTTDHLFVRWSNGDVELYDQHADPHQMENRAQSADAGLVDQLSAWMNEIAGCKGGVSCREAEQTPD